MDPRSREEWCEHTSLRIRSGISAHRVQNILKKYYNALIKNFLSTESLHGQKNVVYRKIWLIIVNLAIVYTFIFVHQVFLLNSEHMILI